MRRAKLIKLEVGTESVSSIMTEDREASRSHRKYPNLSLPTVFSFLENSFISENFD
ncbi:MAG TPA: hypothetical protein HA367_07000 [Candidatus Methanofastidiosum sp.]|nr:hypothetical protein [Methanofastidiosum sp.]